MTTLREQIEALDKGRQHSLDLTAALGFSDYELAIEYGWNEAIAAVLDIIDQHDCVSGREHAYSASIRRLLSLLEDRECRRPHLDRDALALRPPDLALMDTQTERADPDRPVHIEEQP